MEVLLRPENVVLDARGEPGTADGVTARVTSTSFLGNLRRSEVELPDGARVHVQHPAVVVIAVGQEVRIRIEPRPVAARPVAPDVTRQLG